jgi:predicted DCC family thiol-disulfide oxidoreductase YuxK
MSSPEHIFYDGHCGLCHRTVRFVISKDADGSQFRFAPLQGHTFESLVGAASRAGLPDSMVVRTIDGSLLSRSEAFVHILRRLGGVWAIVAALVALVPRPVADAAYDLVARTRFHLFGYRNNSCPVISPRLRARFGD